MGGVMVVQVALDEGRDLEEPDLAAGFSCLHVCCEKGEHAVEVDAGTAAEPQPAQRRAMGAQGGSHLSGGSRCQRSDQVDVDCIGPGLGAQVQVSHLGLLSISPLWSAAVFGSWSLTRRIGWDIGAARLPGRLHMNRTHGQPVDPSAPWSRADGHGAGHGRGDAHDRRAADADLSGRWWIVVASGRSQRHPIGGLQRPELFGGVRVDIEIGVQMTRSAAVGARHLGGVRAGCDADEFAGLIHRELAPLRTRC
jgi:hypothetical protein